MLSTEQKHQIFIKSRLENYQASLRLEGFKPPSPQTKPSTSTDTQPETKSKTKQHRKARPSKP